jgi:hypothetical protein
MPRTIDEGFRDFLPMLTPTPTESEAAKNHRASIESCLENNFGLLRFFRTGSFGNGTSISGYSDVDYFASIPTKYLKQNSSTTLSNLRDALDTRFPRTGVRVDCPAVVVPFGMEKKESTEVVPADFIDIIKTSSQSYHVYKIPDCSGGWMRSSPEIHNLYVRSVDDELGGKVKPLIRFVKAWKYYQQVSVSSFYLELRVTKFVEEMRTIIYSIDLRNSFRNLFAISLAPMEDPMKISGYIAPCASSIKLDEAKSKLATALSHANKARDAEDKENIKDAFDWWNLLFNGNFPSYYK